MSYLLDTNVVSEARKPHGDPHVKAWLASVHPAQLYLSVLVIGEIRLGIERLRPRDHAQAGIYESWLETLERDYADRILPVDINVADEWGKMNAPNPLPVIDGLLAATAKVHNLTVVSRNTDDLKAAGVRLLNPFEPLK